MSNYAEFDEKYWGYAKGVLDGDIIACQYVKQACKRYLDFFDKYEFRPDKVNRVVNFISKLRHYVGKHKGKHFVLQPYQMR